jgi:3-oxoacyl-[acyl-carrier protein] reductase
MDLNLEGKRAVVCGSTQGIGKAIAIEMALLGASITLVARNEVRLKSATKELQDSPSQDHNYLVADFNDPDTLKQKIVAFTRTNVVHIRPAGRLFMHSPMNSAGRFPIISSATRSWCSPVSAV